MKHALGRNLSTLSAPALFALCALCPSVRVLGSDTVCIEVESASDIAAPARITLATEQAASTNKALIKGASGATYLEIPEGTGAKDEKSKTGAASLPFEITEPGEYLLWCRVWWSDVCGNSISMRIDDGPVFTFGQDATYGAWHWLKAPAHLSQLNIAKGKHVLKLMEREDGIALDQVLFTKDKNFVPVGIEDVRQ